MTGVVAYAGATSHVGAIIKNPGAHPERSSILNEAWELMAEQISQAKLDLVIVIGTDHYETFRLEQYPALCLGMAESYEAWGEFGNPEGSVIGHPEFSAHLLGELTGAGFDLSRSFEMPLDHAYMVPILRLGLETTPVVPLFINCNTPPLPSLERCRQLGLAIRAAVEASDGLRVGVIATGGVSHWVGLPRFGDINTEWDAEFLRQLAGDDISEVLARGDEEIIDTAGNGALEIRTWIAAHSAAGSVGGELLAYQPMPDWAIGIGIMRFGETS